MTEVTSPPIKAEDCGNLPSAAEIRRIVDEREAAKSSEREKRKQGAAEEEKHKREMFMARTLTQDAIALIMTRVRGAAENGQSELLIGQFPSAWCSDGGRRINVAEEGWPDTLEGFAREFYEFWEGELKPKGFGLRAEIISFPDGMPGDVGAYLSWGTPSAEPSGSP